MFLEFLSQATLISVEEVSLLAHTITQTAKIRSWIHLIHHCCYFFRKLETTWRSKTMLEKPLNPSLFISRMLAKFKLLVSLGYLGPGSFSRNNLHNVFFYSFPSNELWWVQLLLSSLTLPRITACRSFLVGICLHDFAKDLLWQEKRKRNVSSNTVSFFFFCIFCHISVFVFYFLKLIFTCWYPRFIAFFNFKLIHGRARWDISRLCLFREKKFSI